MNCVSRSSRPTGPKMRVPRGLPCDIDQHGRVVIELDVAAVRPAVFLRCPHDDRANNIALFDAGVRLRLLDGGDDDVADAAILPRRATEHADAHDLACSAVVRDLAAAFVAESRLLILARTASRHPVERPVLNLD